MTVHLAQPLPECTACGRPTRREVHASTGGLCTACSAWQHSVSAVGPERALAGREQLRDWQDTVARIRRAEIATAARRRAARRLRRA